MTCVGGDGCSMPAASALAIFVVSWAARPGEAWGDAGVWQRYAAAPAQRSEEPRQPCCHPHSASKSWEPLARKTFEIFSFHERVFAGQVEHWIAKPASATSGYSRLLGRWDADVGRAALTGSCYVAGVSTHLYGCF